MGLTEELCEKALAIVKPTFQAAMADGTVKREHGFLIVCDPSIPREPKYKKFDGPFQKEVILFSEMFGREDMWAHRYDAVALSKAFISWKTGLPSHRVQQEAPYLYEEGMTKYGGSAVGEGDLVVAFSGVEEYYDQMFSEMMLAAIKAVCLHEMHGPEGVMADKDRTFVGI